MVFLYSKSSINKLCSENETAVDYRLSEEVQKARTGIDCTTKMQPVKKYFFQQRTT